MDATLTRSTEQERTQPFQWADRSAGSDSDQIVARLDAAQLWVDTRAVHVFDLNSGENLTHLQRVRNAALVGS